MLRELAWARNEEWKKLSSTLSKADASLRPLIARLGPPTLEFESNHFRALAESILSQQLATAAARSIIGRFKELERPFPKPSSILKWRIPQLRKVGISKAKASYLKALSERWEDATWRRGWVTLSDEILVERLTEVKGIGVWTAHMFLIFSLGRPDVLPTLDFGIRRGIQLLHRLPELPHPKKVPELVPHWKGMSSVASWYVWKSLDSKLLTGQLKD